jgi:hypothetical protein
MTTLPLDGGGSKAKETKWSARWHETGYDESCASQIGTSRSYG